MSSTCMPFTDPTGKGAEEVNSSCCFNSSEMRVHLMLVGAEVDPVSPILQPDFLSLSHDPVGGVCPCSKVKTSELTLLCRHSISHEVPC